MLDLGDATRIMAVISENFNAVALYGLRELMLDFDYDQIGQYEAEWRARHPDADACRPADESESSKRVHIPKPMSRSPG